jgi:O-antigen/teichoic acid export membrane protein
VTFANRVLYDGLYTFVLRMLNILCAMGMGILTARLLGPAGKGLYALPSVEAGLIASGFAGLSGAMSYFLLHNKTGPAIMRPAIVSTIVFVLVGAVAIVPIAFLAGERWAAWPAIVSLPAAAAVSLCTGYAIGVKRVRHATTLSVAVTVATFILIACGLFLIGRTASVAIVMWIVANTLVALAATVAMLWHARTLEGNEVPTTREFLHFSVRVGLVQLISLLNYRADLYIVAIMTTPAALGIYTVAVSAAESLLVPTQVAALVTSPHIGSLDREAAALLAARCVRNNVLVAAAVCGLIFVCSMPIVRLLYGAAFLGVVPALRILLIGVFALSLGSPISSYFTLKLGKPEVALWLAGGAAAICLSISIALVPSLGISGAATGSTVAYIAGQAAAIWYFTRTTGLSWRTLLIPTRAEAALYAQFALRVFRDARATLGPTTQRP